MVPAVQEGGRPALPRSSQSNQLGLYGRVPDFQEGPFSPEELTGKNKSDSMLDLFLFPGPLYSIASATS